MPILNSIPPSGNKIPLHTIFKAITDGSSLSYEESLIPLQEYLGAKHLFHLPSGRAALWFILRALSALKPNKGEVIIPAYTCPAVASAVLKAGLRPVLVDIDPDNFGLLREGLEKMVGDNTLAVILVHLFGFPANLDEVYEFCKENDTFLIEDSAQAFGNSLPGASERKLGFQADVGFFSFGRGKPLSVLDGGLVVTGSDDISHAATRIYRELENPSMIRSIAYKNRLCLYLLFSNPHLYWIPVKLPFLHLGQTIFEPDFEVSKALRFPMLILTEMLTNANEERKTRKMNSARYSEAFKGVACIRKPPVEAFPYSRYPLIVEANGLRDLILTEPGCRGTGAALFYPCPLNEQPGLREILQDSSAYPNSKRLSENLITLPVHCGVTPSLLEKIKSIVFQHVTDRR